MRCACGSEEVDADPSRGDTVCTACGRVLDEQNIVTEVSFEKDAGGVARAVGQTVRDGGLPYTFGSSGLGQESRNATLQNARQSITQLASRLQLKPHNVETAFHFYKLALAKHLTRGRRSTHVTAACVYMVCRKEGTCHMLLDLSDILKINVFELGRTYLKLSSALCISSPTIDPIIYISRFAQQLQFGERESQVVVDATKLVRRMKSDWIHMGRRPSGLCGAALLVAARLHNFNRSVDDIIKVVKVCHATVRKRLVEFGDTPSGKLSIDEFLTINLSESQDPPCFKNARKKIREFDDENKMQVLDEQLQRHRAEIEKVLENQVKKSRFSNLAEIAGESSGCEGVERLLGESALDSLQGVVPLEQAVVPRMGSLLTPGPEAVGIRGWKVPQKTVQAKTDVLDLSDIDDKELNRYFMANQEYKMKYDFWHKYNEDFLKEQKEREERKALEEAENAKKPKRKRQVRKKFSGEASSAGEAFERMVQQKRISNKLNYDVWRSLDPNMAPPPLQPDAPAPPPNLSFATLQGDGQSPRKRKRPPPLHVPATIRSRMENIVVKNRKYILNTLQKEELPSNLEEPEDDPVEDIRQIPAEVKIEESTKEDLVGADESEDSEDELYGFPKEEEKGTEEYYDDNYAEEYED